MPGQEIVITSSWSGAKRSMSSPRESELSRTRDRVHHAIADGTLHVSRDVLVCGFLQDGRDDPFDLFRQEVSAAGAGVRHRRGSARRLASALEAVASIGSSRSPEDQVSA